MKRRARILLIGVAVLLAPAVAHAQAAGPPNALQGFSKNRDLPVKIDAGSLEVRDKNKIATFSGNVQVVQGDTMMRCKTLQVFYDQQEGSTGNTLTAAKPGPGGQGKIRRLEAKGNVVVTSKEQTATGDKGIFDMAENTVRLEGNVIVSQGTSTLSGERLTVNLTTGVSFVESGKGRVSGVFTPSNIQDQKNQQQNGKTQGEKTQSAKPQGESARSATGDTGTTQSTQSPQHRPPHPSGLY